MTDLARAVDLSLFIDDSIYIKPYNEIVMMELDSILLWDHLDTNKYHNIKFGDDSWSSPENKQSITFCNTTPKFSYQLKAMTLAMHSQGAGEGMPPLSWNTIRQVIATLKRFGSWLAKYGVSEIDALNDMEELKIRNIIHKMITEMKMNEHPSYAKLLLIAMYWARTYKLITTPATHQLMKEYLDPFVQLSNQRHRKYSIIPPRIFKKILHESELRVEKVDQVFKSWSEIQLYLNEEISTLSSGYFHKTTYIKALDKEAQINLSKLHQPIDKLRSYVFLLVLGYSGMRYSEAMELRDNAAFSKEGKYFIKTLLSKTTDGSQSLEWIINKTTYDAVTLLSKINLIYRERAKLLLAHQSNSLPKKRLINMKYGLENRRLFNVRHHKQGCEFMKNIKLSVNGFANINNFFSIPVTAEDIELLNRMNCNYQSVSANHHGFRKQYKIGVPFNFSAHQLRHTFAWFIIANRLGDLDDIKYQFKHLDNSMTLVYGQRGYESMEEMINLTENFNEFMISQAMNDMVQAAEEGNLAGLGGQSFMIRLTEIMGDDLSTGKSPHFSSMEELLKFTAKHSSNFRGLSHGYCTKGNECKVKNVSDPSHCINCHSYIATPKHLPHWLVIKERCENQLKSFDNMPDEMKQRFLSFSTALIDNLNAANTIISQLTTQEKMVKHGI